MTPDARRLDETPVPGAVPRLELAEWRERYGVVAGITGRGDGFDLGLHSTNPAGVVLDRWHQLFAAMAPGFCGFAVGRQVHGASVSSHVFPITGWLVQDAVDGHLTTVPGNLLLVTVADCVPVYVLHPASRGLALLHAGWRGIAAGVLEAGVRALTAATGAVARDLVIHCGVSICEMCYEVGSEVHQAVRGSPTPGPRSLDLRAELLTRAARLGVGMLSRSGWCAAHEPRRFFSHRRSNGVDGRMAAYLGAPVA